MNNLEKRISQYLNGDKVALIANEMHRTGKNLKDTDIYYYNLISGIIADAQSEVGIMSPIAYTDALFSGIALNICKNSLPVEVKTSLVKRLFEKVNVGSNEMFINFESSSQMQELAIELGAEIWLIGKRYGEDTFRKYEPLTFARYDFSKKYGNKYEYNDNIDVTIQRIWNDLFAQRVAESSERGDYKDICELAEKFTYIEETLRYDLLNNEYACITDDFKVNFFECDGLEFNDEDMRYYIALELPEYAYYVVQANSIYLDNFANYDDAVAYINRCEEEDKVANAYEPNHYTIRYEKK